MSRSSQDVELRDFGPKKNFMELASTKELETIIGKQGLFAGLLDNSVSDKQYELEILAYLDSLNDDKKAALTALTQEESVLKKVIADAESAKFTGELKQKNIVDKLIVMQKTIDKYPQFIAQKESVQVGSDRYYRIPGEMGAVYFKNLSQAEQTFFSSSTPEQVKLFIQLNEAKLSKEIYCPPNIPEAEKEQYQTLALFRLITKHDEAKDFGEKVTAAREQYLIQPHAQFQMIVELLGKSESEFKLGISALLNKEPAEEFQTLLQSLNTNIAELNSLLPAPQYQRLEEVRGYLEVHQAMKTYFTGEMEVFDRNLQTITNAQVALLQQQGSQKYLDLLKKTYKDRIDKLLSIPGNIEDVSVLKKLLLEERKPFKASLAEMEIETAKKFANFSDPKFKKYFESILKPEEKEQYKKNLELFQAVSSELKTIQELQSVLCVEPADFSKLTIDDRGRYIELLGTKNWRGQYPFREKFLSTLTEEQQKNYQQNSLLLVASSFSNSKMVITEDSKTILGFLGQEENDFKSSLKGFLEKLDQSIPANRQLYSDLKGKLKDFEKMLPKAELLRLVQVLENWDAAYKHHLLQQGLPGSSINSIKIPMHELLTVSTIEEFHQKLLQFSDEEVKVIKNILADSKYLNYLDLMYPGVDVKERIKLLRDTPENILEAQALKGILCCEADDFKNKLPVRNHEGTAKLIKLLDDKTFKNYFEKALISQEITQYKGNIELFKGAPQALADVKKLKELLCVEEKAFIKDLNKVTPQERTRLIGLLDSEDTAYKKGGFEEKFLFILTGDQKTNYLQNIRTFREIAATSVDLTDAKKLYDELSKSKTDLIMHLKSSANLDKQVQLIKDKGVDKYFETLGETPEFKQNRNLLLHHGLVKAMFRQDELRAEFLKLDIPDGIKNLSQLDAFIEQQESQLDVVEEEINDLKAAPPPDPSAITTKEDEARELQKSIEDLKKIKTIWTSLDPESIPKLLEHKEKTTAFKLKEAEVQPQIEAFEKSKQVLSDKELKFAQIGNELERKTKEFEALKRTITGKDKERIEKNTAFTNKNEQFQIIRVIDLPSKVFLYEKTAAEFLNKSTKMIILKDEQRRMSGIIDPIQEQIKGEQALLERIQATISRFEQLQKRQKVAETPVPVNRQPINTLISQFFSSISPFSKSMPQISPEVELTSMESDLTDEAHLYFTAEEINDEIEKFKKLSTEQNDKITELKKQIDILKLDELQAEVNQLEIVVTELKAKKDKLKIEILKLKTEKDALGIEVTELKAKKDELEKEVTGLTSKTGELEEECKKLERTSNSLDLEIKNSKAKMDKQEQIINGLTAELDVLKTAIPPLESFASDDTLKTISEVSSDSASITIPEGCVIKSFTQPPPPASTSPTAEVKEGGPILGKFSSITLHSEHGHDISVHASGPNRVITVLNHQSLTNRTQAMYDFALMAYEEWTRNQKPIVINAASAEDATLLDKFFKQIKSQDSHLYQFNPAQHISFRGKYRPEQGSSVPNLDKATVQSFKDKLAAIKCQTKEDKYAQQVIKFLNENFASSDLPHKIGKLAPELQQRVRFVLEQAIDFKRTSQPPSYAKDMMNVKLEDNVRNIAIANYAYQKDLKIKPEYGQAKENLEKLQDKSTRAVPNPSDEIGKLKRDLEVRDYKNRWF